MTKRVASPGKPKVGENKGNQFFLKKLMTTNPELRTASSYTFKVIKPGEIYEIISYK